MVSSAFLWLIVIGLIAGLLSGVFGIGGGVINVPCLIYLLGFSQHKATGTSLAVLLPPIGIAAVFEYYQHDNVDLKKALIIALTSIVGAWVGSVYANKLTGPALRLSFGISVTLLGLYLIYEAMKRYGWL